MEWWCSSPANTRSRNRKALKLRTLYDVSRYDAVQSKIKKTPGFYNASRYKQIETKEKGKGVRHSGEQKPGGDILP